MPKLVANDALVWHGESLCIFAVFFVFSSALKAHSGKCLVDSVHTKFVLFCVLLGVTLEVIFSILALS